MIAIVVLVFATLTWAMVSDERKREAAEDKKRTEEYLKHIEKTQRASKATHTAKRGVKKPKASGTGYTNKPKNSNEFIANLWDGVGKDWYSVIEVFDGDTIAIWLNGEYTKIRFRYIDTLETGFFDSNRKYHKLDNCKYGLKAKALLEKHVKSNGGKVKLDFTVGEGETKKGYYGRRLAYIHDYTTDVVSKGLALVKDDYPMPKHIKHELLTLENKAIKSRIGIYTFEGALETKVNADIINANKGRSDD